MRKGETEVRGEELLDVRSSNVDGLLNLGNSENLQSSSRQYASCEKLSEKWKNANRRDVDRSVPPIASAWLWKGVAPGRI